MIHNDTKNRAATKGGAIARLLALGFTAIAAFGASSGEPLSGAISGIGGGVADSYRMAQLRLLDGALSQKAEDALHANFSAIRKAQVNLQTELGGRKSHVAVNVIGDLPLAAEDYHSAGWQVRVYAGEKDSKGANSGFFYRRMAGNALYGINLFTDYEDGNHGNFFRYSFGGEVRNTLFAFNANYYLPETEARGISDGRRAFSRRGYDMQFRFNVPGYNFLKVRADYYNFDGKEAETFGDMMNRMFQEKVDKEDGFRYGAEFGFPPFDGLKVAVVYDTGAKKLGGDLTFTHVFGAPSFKHSGGHDIAGFDDRFTAVPREYAQRIGIQQAPTPVSP